MYSLFIPMPEMPERRRIATTYRLDTWVTDNLVDLAEQAGESVNAYVEKVLFKHCIENLPEDKRVEPLGDQRRKATKRGLKVVGKKND
ncbi:hypothetical protein NIES3275_80990 (plasmid) [Microchaete diplosiphon NIES-3275]|nr:hypothetical protein NIES3275_80990 [Microchaete diplosiphon NIES-3275]